MTALRAGVVLRGGAVGLPFGGRSGGGGLLHLLTWGGKLLTFICNFVGKCVMILIFGNDFS